MTGGVISEGEGKGAREESQGYRHGQLQLGSQSIIQIIFHFRGVFKIISNWSQNEPQKQTASQIWSYFIKGTRKNQQSLKPFVRQTSFWQHI